MNKVLLLLFLLIPSFIVKSQPRHQYLLDDNSLIVTDVMGNLNATLEGGASTTTSPVYQGARAGAFVSSTARMEIPNFDFTTGGKAISFWMYFTLNSGYPAIMSNRVGSNGTGCLLFSNASNGTLYFRTHNGSTSNDIVTSSSAYTANEYTHVLINIADISGAYGKIWINGEDVTTDSVMQTGWDLTSTLAFGGEPGGTASSMWGYLDNIQIYDKYLSPSEIDSLYDLGNTSYYLEQSEPEPPTSGLLASYGLNRKYSLYNGFFKIKTYNPTNVIPPIGPGAPVIVWAENFDTISTGLISTNQRLAWNIQQGTWINSRILIESEAGRGNVLRFNIQQGTLGEPLANTKIMLDSIYRDLYFQYDVYLQPDYMFGTGGKTFGSLFGGPEPHIPYHHDYSVGFNTLITWVGSGKHHWYLYTQNPTGIGYPLTLTTQIPPDSYTGSVYGNSYSWGYNIDPYWPNKQAGWPLKTEWNGSAWAWLPEYDFSLVRRGEWYTVTQHVRLEDDGQWNDMFEYFINGECVYSEGDNRFRIADSIHVGIEGLYINVFHGGGSPADVSPQDQYKKVDNLIAYYYPTNHPKYHSTPMLVGDSIDIIDNTLKLVTSPAMPVDGERYTDASGVIYSHNKAFNHIPGPTDPNNITATKWISVVGATAYSVTMNQFARSLASNYYKQWVKIYRYNGGASTLVKTYDYQNYTLGTTSMSCDSVKIEYNTGQGREPNQETGWRATYTSNGVGSGNNPVYPSKMDMIANLHSSGAITAASINQGLGKGVNVVDIVPYGGTCTPQWTSNYYDAIVAGGFNHVRAVFFGFNETGGANYEIQPTVLANVKTIIDEFLSRGIKVVLDYHQPGFLNTPNQTNYDRFVSHWGQLANYFKTYDVRNLVFELTNEPKEDYTTWNTLVARSVSAIREYSSETERIIMVPPALWSQVAGLPYLSLPDDDGLILTIHYYKPTTFTHQGMSGNEGAVGGHWYNVRPMVKEIDEYFAPLLSFSQAHNIPVNIGEYGVNKDYGAELADRAAYTNYHARYFDSKWWSHAIWDFKQDFGIYTSGAYIQDMLDAIMTDPMPTLSSYDSTVVYQSNFGSGYTGWTSTNASLSVNEDVLVATVTTPGSIPTDVIVQYPISLEKNKIYRVTYTVSSATSRYSIIKTPYLEWDQPTITTLQYTNERSFTHYFSNYSGYIQFCIGGSSSNFYIHNFKIETIDLL